MPIRSVARFRVDADKDILHHKSEELKDVIEKLGQYHENSTRDRLIHLRDSMVRWQEKNPWEFASRGGNALMTEVLHAVRGLIGPAKPSVRNSLPLIDGDILFRWFPRGLKEKFKDAPAERGILQGIISEGQMIQDSVHQYTPLEIDVEGLSVYLHRQDPLEGINVEHSVINLQHVGIYVNETVIEIGPTGLERHTVAGREHYDLVVRTRSHGGEIAKTVLLARTGNDYWSASLLNRANYPVWDLLNVMIRRHRGALARKGITEDHDFEKYSNNRYVIQQRVICSHFVNAVLYMAFRRKGTIAAATSHEYDDIFKVSPAQMWKEFLYKQGVWAEPGVEAFFAGLQHKGEILPDIDPRSLGVGLQ